MSNHKQTEYDAIIIGSGFGGSMVAHVLVNAGKKVLMLERGDWVPRGEHNWADDASVELTPYYSKEIPYRVLAGGNSKIMGAYTCVGGPSVFYGGVSMRLREADFEMTPEIVGNSDAHWPYKYADLESFYCQAEEILGIAGEPGDPTEPNRSKPFPGKLGKLSEASQMIDQAADDLGYHPFRLPLAINYGQQNGQAQCIACPTCDTFACAIQAKNDLATRVLPGLIEKGLEIKVNTVAVKLKTAKGRISQVDCFDKKLGEKKIYHAKLVILSAGSLASPHLLLASGLEQLNPGGDVVGRYLTRHCNAIAFGFFSKRPDPNNEFHKQLGIHDFYFGHASIKSPEGKLGSMQQLQTPPIGLVKGMLPKPIGKFAALFVPHLTGLIVMAEDQPKYENHLALDRSKSDRFGLPQLQITHHYTKRDYAARDALLKKAQGILKKAGAILFYKHKIKTFSHAVGTVRMGESPESSALDQYCQFRGIDNLFVVDGSFMPTSGGLNPSLTISANALRVGRHILKNEIC
ncbi:GMC family oxidoreductase [candidate division KSB1 bacterium]|nr:GMC family oxidoreductase [candidate division KSB1 bacterium]